MWAYCLGLRLRILRACDAGGETREEVAETFGVSPAPVYELLRQREGLAPSRLRRTPAGRRGRRTRRWRGCAPRRRAGAGRR
jgi:transposase